MLFYKTIDFELLELIKKLQKEPLFASLRLVGGTSLALQIGHRKSIDIDLFGTLEADQLSISKTLDKFGPVTVLNKSENIHIFIVNGIKVDIVNYHYPWLSEPVLGDDLNLADIKDISAMKLNALAGRGTKKDFIDLYFLLQVYSLEELLSFYSRKYHDGSSFMVLKSLTYFEDAEQNEMPVMLKPIEWENVKNFINACVKKHFML